jgi:NADH dehydrogenase/NADH:ubiquinone oxidoreductase subunit G
MRILDHPILGRALPQAEINIMVNGSSCSVLQGDTIASAMVSLGLRVHRYTEKGAPRGIFCNNGKCSDCLVQVDGIPNVRACITPVREGMIIETQRGKGSYLIGKNNE